MSYQVIARKWRPQKFDDVVFQEHVSKTIQNSIKAGRISHAYIFSGPRGVGKTTMARILARALNCVNGPTPEPCGVCENCVEIKNGTFFDVMEIDGASNNGVEDIRELRENVNFAPVKGRYKVYIIDEVHMVTTQAFNALLKTLEEPPEHAVFVLATTELHKIPDTILSRCQKYFFKQIPVDKIAEHLKHIADKEGYPVSDSAIYPIARAAGGSMRDAQSLLDQVISYSSEAADGGQIGEAEALTILGIVPAESYVRQFRNIASGDSAAIIGEIARVAGMGADISRYAGGFIDVLRSLRLMKSGIALNELLGLSKEEAHEFREVAALYHDEELSRMFRLCMELISSLKFSTDERINLEMSMLDMAAVKKAPSVASIIRALGAGNAPSGGTVKNAVPKKSAGSASADEAVMTQTISSTPEKKAVNVSAAVNSTERKDNPAEPGSSVSPAVEKIKNVFHGQIVERGE